MRIGVLGLGFMGTTHLKAWRNVPNATIAAVCSDDPQKLTGDLSAIQGNLGDGGDQQFDFSRTARYRQTEALLADPNVDAVDICLPTHLHSSVAIAALRAGKHTLVEKPMALDGAAADEMLAVAKNSGKVLMVGQVLRFFPAYRVMADAIASGEYGAVRYALLRRRCAAPFWSKWLSDASRSGGGVFDLLIHDVDFAIHMFGQPESVSATGYEDMPNGIDTITATLQYANGPAVVITGGWHHKKAYPFSMEFTVVADGGTFEFSSLRGSGVTLYIAAGEASEMQLPERDAFAAELAYFVECCRDGRTPALCPPEESAASVKLTRCLLKARDAAGERLACAI
jgi:predicted dehydrogenase